MAKSKKKLGRVVIDLGYVVDMNDEEMVQHAKDNFYEDIMNAVKNEELTMSMSVVVDPKASVGDIPAHLTEE